MKRAMTILLLTFCVWGAAGPVSKGVAQQFDVQAALEAAPEGAVIRIPAGVYPGPLVLRKPVTIEADGEVIFDGGGGGDVVRIEAPDVTVRGLIIRNTGKSLDHENAGFTVLEPRATIENNVLEDVLFGIYLKASHDSIIRNNMIGSKDLNIARRGDAIRIWQSPRTLIENNIVNKSRDVVVWFSDDVVIRKNQITNGRYGLHFMYSNRNILEDNRLEGNSVGAFLMYSHDLIVRRNIFKNNRGASGFGMGLKDMDGVSAYDNAFVGNRIGLQLANSPSSTTITDIYERNLFAFNDIGVAFMPSVQGNHFFDNSFIENIEQVGIHGGGNFKGNLFTVNGRGNFWSDYHGYDADGDGIGDMPYKSESLFENLMDREPQLRLFLFSPAQQAVELAAKAFPAVKPRPKLIDENPLMHPVLASVPRAEAIRPSRMYTLSGILLGASGLLLCTGLYLSGNRRGPARRIVELKERKTVTKPMIQIQSLTKRFGRLKAVDDLSFDVQAGEAVALWGINGAGKTTVIRCLIGLLRCKGEMFVAGKSFQKEGKAVRRLIGYVPQELAYYNDMTAINTLRFFARLKKTDPANAKSVLAEVGLVEHGTKRIGALSGGMKQRLALAIALLADPPLLILDEPTSNLDAEARNTFLVLLQGLKAKGKTILFTSHRIEEVLALADRVLVLKAGRLDKELTAQELAKKVGNKTLLRLYLTPEQTNSALELLCGEGFTAERRNGCLFVQTQYGQKTAPIRLLEAKGLIVRDFDLESVEE